MKHAKYGATVMFVVSVIDLRKQVVRNTVAANVPLKRAYEEINDPALSVKASKYCNQVRSGIAVRNVIVLHNSAEGMRLDSTRIRSCDPAVGEGYSSGRSEGTVGAITLTLARSVDLDYDSVNILKIFEAIIMTDPCFLRYWSIRVKPRVITSFPPHC
jgi:hypothetical protein